MMNAFGCHERTSFWASSGSGFGGRRPNACRMVNWKIRAFGRDNSSTLRAMVETELRGPRQDIGKLSDEYPQFI
jgi:hypothetical protein